MITNAQHVVKYIFIHFVTKKSNNEVSHSIAPIVMLVAIGVNGIVKNAMIAHMV
jgi:hypothetical protein